MCGYSWYNCNWRCCSVTWSGLRIRNGTVLTVFLNSFYKTAMCICVDETRGWDLWFTWIARISIWKQYLLLLILVGYNYTVLARDGDTVTCDVCVFWNGEEVHVRWQQDREHDIHYRHVRERDIWPTFEGVECDHRYYAGEFWRSSWKTVHFESEFRIINNLVVDWKDDGWRNCVKD